MTPSDGAERFSSFDGTRIAYWVAGAEDGAGAVLLHHGFASTAAVNWVRPGLVAALVGAGRRVVYLDARGHGASDHPHDPARYREGAMCSDVALLLDHLGLERVDVAGYSMGAFVAIELALADARVRSLFLGGVGLGQERTRRPEVRAAIAAALEADDPARLGDASARSFRTFADATKQDRFALAALQRGGSGFDGDRAAAVSQPALVVNGRDDTLAGDPHLLAERMQRAGAKVIPGDHLSAVVKPEFKDVLVAWAMTPP